jgi:hypothetical protein
MQDISNKLNDIKNTISLINHKLDKTTDTHVTGLPINVRMRETGPSDNMFNTEEEIELDFD